MIFPQFLRERDHRDHRDIRHSHNAMRKLFEAVSFSMF